MGKALQLFRDKDPGAGEEVNSCIARGRGIWGRQQSRGRLEDESNDVPETGEIAVSPE
jgi:hypothetical protein